MSLKTIDTKDNLRIFEFHEDERSQALEIFEHHKRARERERLCHIHGYHEF